MTVLFDNRFAEISHEGDTLTLTWHPETSAMSEEEFQMVLLQFAELAMTEGVHHLLMNLKDLGFVPEPGFDAWREQEVIPRYNTADIRRFAMVFAPGHVPGAALQDPGASYECANFDDVSAAAAWLSQD